MRKGSKMSNVKNGARGTELVAGVKGVFNSTDRSPRKTNPKGGKKQGKSGEDR